MDDISARVGDRIKQIRNNKSISQEELALTSSLNRAFVGQIERGGKNASVKTIEKICIGLDVTLHEFFSFELDEIDIPNDSLIKISAMFKELDDKQISQVVDLIRQLIAFKNS